MSQQPSPSRGFGLVPLFRGPSAGQQLRVSDAEREAVTDRLAEHYAEGRLDHDEFDQRVGRAMGAKTRADLDGLFADLPESASRGPRATETAPPAQPHRRGHPVLLGVLAIVIFLAAAHAVFAGPWLWLGLAAAMLIISRRTRYGTPRQHH